MKPVLLNIETPRRKWRHASHYGGFLSMALSIKKGFILVKVELQTLNKNNKNQWPLFCLLSAIFYRIKSLRRRFKNMCITEWWKYKLKLLTYDSDITCYNFLKIWLFPCSEIWIKIRLVYVYLDLLYVYLDLLYVYLDLLYVCISRLNICISRLTIFM